MYSNEYVIRAPATDTEWEAYYDLRYRILREPLLKPRGSEKNERDATGIHFALFSEGRILAIGRLDQAEPGVAQARFVAVESDQQGNGLGRIVMNVIEECARARGNYSIVLHARDYALPFYEKLGYKIVEKSHLLFGVLQHYFMQKQL